MNKDGFGGRRAPNEERGKGRRDGRRGEVGEGEERRGETSLTAQRCSIGSRRG